MSEDWSSDPERGVRWAVLCLGGLALVLIGLAWIAGTGVLGGGWLADLLRSDAISTVSEVLWALSVLLAAFFAGLDEKWGWLIAILLVPLAQMAYAAQPIYDARFKREERLDYASPGARAAADAEHSMRGSSR